MQRLAKPSLITLFLIFLIIPVAMAQTDDYNITKWTVDTGGGNLSNNGYQLVGTIGQQDATIWQGSNYTLAGGFWGGAFSSDENYIYLPVIMQDTP